MRRNEHENFAFRGIPFLRLTGLHMANNIRQANWNVIE